jgi:uncharacterized protein YjbJ (UPF0337 family)
MMNKQTFKGHWHKIKGKLKAEWDELTEDDLSKIEANNQEIYGILMERYGYAKDEVKRTVREFMEEVSLPDLNDIKNYAVKGTRAPYGAIKENPVKSFFIALSTLAFIRRVRRSVHH